MRPRLKGYPLLMNNRPTAIERAFELASTGYFQRVEEIRRAVTREGYPESHLDGPFLSKQLREAIKKAREERQGARAERGELEPLDDATAFGAAD